MSTAGPSKAGSTSSTPAPPSQAEALSHAGVPKPFKSSTFNKTLNRRNKALKQIVTAERDVALGITNRSKKRKTGEEPLVFMRGKTKLAGAAARAALKREAREKKEAAAEAAAAGEGEVEGEGEGEAAEGSLTPSGAADRTIDRDPDTTMEDASNAGDTTAANTPKVGASPEPPRKDLPMCEWSAV